MVNQVQTVPRKPSKPDGKPADDTKQIAFRAPRALAARLESTAKRLGLDPSGLIRMMILKHLPEYEREADAVEGKE